jgi:hypothetical protein
VDPDDGLAAVRIGMKGGREEGREGGRVGGGIDVFGALR